MGLKNQGLNPARNSSSRHKLQQPDLIVILRGADDLNQRGGPDMLAQMLKGDTSPQIRHLGLENSPVFGALQHRKLDQILERIQQAIEENYLTLTGNNSKTRLALTDSGWEIEYEIVAAEILADFDTLLEQTGTPDISEIIHTSTRVQMQTLELIEASGDRKYSTILATWGAFANRKVRIRIEQVLIHLDSGS